MAAVRQFFNARAVGVPAKEEHSPSDETQRKIEAKMQAMGYSISPPIPNDALSIRNLDQQTTRPLHSKFNDVEPQQPLHRKLSVEGTYNKNTSFDQNSGYRPQPLRSATSDNIHGLVPTGAHMEERSSFYEDGEQSPALSPALHKHLALRPLETHAQEQQQHHKQGHQRRRSRSATNDSNNYNGEQNLWDSYAKDRKHKPRQESLRSASKPLPSQDGHDGSPSSRTMQMLRDRQKSPTSDSGRYNTQPLIDPNQGGATKEAHNFSSPTDSVSNSISSEAGHANPRKRSRDLDYSMDQLGDMDYQRLKDESFDYIPMASTNISHHDLPDPNLTLQDRLHAVFSDRNPKDKAFRARGFFASLTIDQYEECGDLLLDSFQNVMGKLKQARRHKRQAAQAMELQIAKREEWVRKKRGICEVELGRLRSAGVAVVKPIKPRTHSR
ncbi:hypothetical protein P7C71_g6405, partial [Lecanoromycetidae sp. Uapishka_2]